MAAIEFWEILQREQLSLLKVAPKGFFTVSKYCIQEIPVCFILHDIKTKFLGNIERPSFEDF